MPTAHMTRGPRHPRSRAVAPWVGFVAALATLTWIDRTSQPRQRVRPDLATPIITQGGPVAGRRDGRDRAVPTRDRDRIEHSARAFLAGYLPYTHGHPAALRALGADTVEPALSQGLLAERPHVTDTQGRFRVRRVLVERLSTTHAAAVAEVSEPHLDYAVALTLQKRAGAWQVTDLHPAG